MAHILNGCIVICAVVAVEVVVVVVARNIVTCTVVYGGTSGLIILWILYISIYITELQ